MRHLKLCLIVVKALRSVPLGGERSDSFLAFARDTEDLGAVGVYNLVQVENKLSNPYYLTPFSHSVPYC